MKLQVPDHFDFQGHRGCRGLMPENTIPAMLHALQFGVNTLEMDLVISKDLQVVVSHDPFMSHEICLSPEGEEISIQEEKKHNLYQLTYEEITKYDCGIKPHPRFPQQKKVAIHKPLLSDLLYEVKKYSLNQGLPDMFFNMEIKSTPEGDHIFHPSPEQFSHLVIVLLKEQKVLERTIIQCFDLRPLQYIHQKYPEVKLSLLVENKLSIQENIQHLGFYPPIYSPEYILVNSTMIQYCQQHQMKVLPWTVNTAEEIQTLADMGVDGVISDYLFER